MVIHGRIENGVIVADVPISLPDGTEVTIVVCAADDKTNDPMSAREREQYLAALAEIDALPNENPGDRFRGADHDRALYE